MKRLSLTFAIVCLLLFPTIAWGQTDMPTLRDLAARKNFYVVTAVSSWTLSSESDLKKVIGTNFNQITPENDAKLCFVEPREGQYDFAGLDSIVKLAEAN